MRYFAACLLWKALFGIGLGCASTERDFADDTTGGSSGAAGALGGGGSGGSSGAAAASGGNAGVSGGEPGGGGGVAGAAGGGGMPAGGGAGAPSGGSGGSAGSDPAESWSLRLRFDKTGQSVGTGTVEIERDGALVACGADCDTQTMHAGDSEVTLTVRPVGKSGYWFTGWEGDCSGQQAVCTLTMDRARSVTAKFAAVNFAFISSESFTGTEGAGLGARPYDDHCNRLATAAGINNGDGDAYTALLADATSTPAQRLTGARGWIRVDGQPFMDVFSEMNVMNALSVTETGSSVTGHVRTLVSTKLVHCSNWTDPNGTVDWGVATGGPSRWLSGPPSGAKECGAARQIYCMSKRASVPMSIPRRPGSKLIYLSSSALPVGIVTPDEHCQATKPAGAGSVQALLARDGLAASAFLSSTAEYVRPDGVLVGTGAELAGGVVRSGIWQQGNGTYVALGPTASPALTGAAAPIEAGSAASTAEDWSNPSAMAVRGADWGDVSRWWMEGVSLDVGAGGTHRIYCVEQ